ncbi:MAG: DHH family phosphoesterase, partial [Lachnospiraceae bacterium]|nr:DHH family phosphoesterase [Lachnospiraceae bacterium]
GYCDCSCSSDALYLRKCLPKAQVDVYLETLPAEREKNIPGADTILHTVPEDEARYDAFILLDSVPGRTGDAEKLYQEAALTINIDHHISNPGSGDVNYIDAAASSASELVFNVIDHDAIDKEIAQALYVGMVTDTGVFQYSSTGESTMRAAGHLMSYGFDFTAVIREVFFERTALQAKMLGEAFVRAELSMNGKCMFSILDKALLDRYDATRQDLDGISAQLALTKGIDCAVFLHEDAPGVWRASMRSVKIVNVAALASRFQGGGHIRAAGCTITSDLEEAVRLLKYDIALQRKDAGAL